MPPLTRNSGDRELQVMIANPARTAHAVATGQQSGTSGQIPGTSSDPTQLATLTGTIQSYPNGPSPNGDAVAGIGHQILNNAGNPVVVMGNLNATQTGGTDLPADFQDGGFAFVDADGNLPAGYSQETGLWGFTAGTVVVHAFAFAYNTSGLLTGVPFYTPTTGDILLDAWFEIDTNWIGTAPNADIGNFGAMSGANGLFQWAGAEKGVDLSNGGDTIGGGGHLLTNDGVTRLSTVDTLGQIGFIGFSALNKTPNTAANVYASGTTQSIPLSLGEGTLPITFLDATPLCVCVSATGQPSGGSPGTTSGTARVCVMTTTPISASA